jgi:hypothetical protein
MLRRVNLTKIEEKVKTDPTFSRSGEGGGGRVYDGDTATVAPWRSLAVGVTRDPIEETGCFDRLSASELKSAWLVTGTANKPTYHDSTKCTIIVCAELDFLKVGDTVTTEVCRM